MHQASFTILIIFIEIYSPNFSTSITYTNEHKYYGEKYQNGIKHGYVKANLAVELPPWRKLVVRMHQFDQIIVIVGIK